MTASIPRRGRPRTTPSDGSAGGVARSAGEGARRDRAVRRADDLLEHLEVDLLQVLQVQAADPGRVRPEPGEQLGVGPYAVREVDGRGRLPRGEAGSGGVAL